MKASIILVSAALGVLTSTGGVCADTTNVLAKVTIHFTVRSRGPVTTNDDGTVTEKIRTTALNTAGLIAALGTDTNLTSTGFSNNAYLAIDTVLSNGVRLPPVFVVVEDTGTNQTITPVDSDISFSTLGDVLRDGVIDTNSGFERLTAYRMRTFDVNITNQWTLNMSGLVLRNVLKITQGPPQGQITVDDSDADWNLTGYGEEQTGTNTTSVIVTGVLFTSHDENKDYNEKTRDNQ